MSFISSLFGNKTDFKELIRNGAIIIDVRSPGEFNTGHVAGSKNYPLDTIRSKMAELKKLGKPIIAVCLSGTRSGAAVSLLKQTGIEAYNGGGWTSLERALR